jgi:hypothetical protein
VPEVRPILAALDGVDLLALHHVRLDGVALGQNAKAAGEGDLRIVVKLLVGEEHNEALEPDGPDGRDGLVVEVGRAVDASDLGTDRGPERADIQRHLAQCHRPMVAQGV